MWGHIAEAEYRAERRTIERELAELPLPADSNVLAFDRSAARLLPFADVLRQATAEHQMTADLLLPRRLGHAHAADGDPSQGGWRLAARSCMS